eukprot:scaffold24729_cov117-Isochrysis_galbana.AAC.7
MSGVSRFLELPAPWRYSKAENLPAADLQSFSHLLVGSNVAPVAGFELLHEEQGFARASLRPPFLLTEPKIHVLSRKAERVDRRRAPPEAEPRRGAGGDFFL